MFRLSRLVACLLFFTLLSACGNSTVPVPTLNEAATASSANTDLTATSADLARATTTPEQAATTPAPPSATNSALSGTTKSLTVFAAASLSEAFTEIGKQFDAANGTQTRFNFAGSQQLAQQIVQGAPVDVFASANRAQMEAVIEAGEVISGTQQTFVRNRLVVIYPRANPAGLTQLEDLARPGVKLVLAAKEVPVGQYALDFLRNASQQPQFNPDYSETVLANVVSYEENVRAVLSKVVLGEADAGIIYTSDVSHTVADEVGRIDIPDELNTIAAYPIAPSTAAGDGELAQKFIAYVLSPAGQSILSQYGFMSIAGAKLPTPTP